ncbi:MAG: hypothetical protein QM758_06390 [Armatimonas sp.]
MENNEKTLAARVRARLASALSYETDSPTLAPALKRLQQANAITPLEQAIQIGTTLVGLDRLALCKLPREEQFVQDSEVIAEYCGCEPDALLSLLRTIQVLDTFAQTTASTSPSLSERPAWQSGGILIAARDANDIEEPQEGADNE